MNPEQLQHWRTQVARFLDGKLPESDTRLLNEELRGSEELRREFAILARQEVQLRELAAEVNVAPSRSRQL